MIRVYGCHCEILLEKKYDAVFFTYIVRLYLFCVYYFLQDLRTTNKYEQKNIFITYEVSIAMLQQINYTYNKKRLFKNTLFTR